MGGRAVICSNGGTCGYSGYPSVCKDCTRNAMAIKGSRFDLYHVKKVENEAQREKNTRLENI